jgi:hypothetical protein
MPWVRLDDSFPDNPKVDGLSDGAFRLYVSALCYAGHYLTDGLIETSRASRLVPGKLRRSCIQELLDAGLWDAHPDGWMIHHFLEYNPPSHKVKADRQAAAERMRNRRRSPERSGERTGERSRARSGARSATPSRPHSDLHHPLTHGRGDPPPADDDDDERQFTDDELRQARSRAEQKLADQQARGATIAHPERWLAAATRNELANPTTDPADLTRIHHAIWQAVQTGQRPTFDPRTEAAIAALGGWTAIRMGPGDPTKHRAWFAAAWTSTAATA